MYIYVLTQLHGLYACYELVTCGPLDYKYTIAPKHGFIILNDIIIIEWKIVTQYLPIISAI